MVCFEFEISQEDVDDLETGFQSWVIDYERCIFLFLYIISLHDLIYVYATRLYYQHDPERVACCPLTVHALLHIAPAIRAMGPVWAYWAFPMERYCGDIGRNIKSRRFPYATINKYITSQAQLTHVTLLYGLHDKLSLRPPQSDVKDLKLPLCECFSIYIYILTISSD